MSLDEAERLARDIVASDPNVEYAEPDRIMRRTLTPNDTRYNEQWHYFEAAGGINAPPAWDKSTGAGVVTAVIDTGYRPHADLAGNILPGYDFISDTFVANDGNGRDSDASDPGDWINAGECGPGDPAAFESSSWHGTHVAGTIAALTNNASGVAGIAFNAKVVPARVLGKCGGYTSDIADAIVWTSGGSVSGVPANANPAKVLNISLGGGGSLRHHDAERDQLRAFARRIGDRGGGQQQRQLVQLLAGELQRRGDGRRGRTQRRQGVVFELRRDGGSGGARRQWRREQRVVDAQHGLHGSWRGQLRALQRHVDGDAARRRRGRADAVGEADADARTR